MNHDDRVRLKSTIMNNNMVGPGYDKMKEKSYNKSHSHHNMSHATSKKWQMVLIKLTNVPKHHDNVCAI